jgi:hypothetical protein
MTVQSERVDEDARASAQQLVDWLQELVADRPAVRAAITQCLRTLVLDARRRQIQTHLERLDEGDLATVAALITQLQRHPREDPT